MTFKAAEQSWEQALQDGGVRMCHLLCIMKDWGDARAGGSNTPWLPFGDFCLHQVSLCTLFGLLECR